MFSLQITVHPPTLRLLLLAEMLESNNLVTFEGLANSSAYHTFLLDEERGRLVVGAKDHIFSFNLLNVSRDYTKVTQKRLHF